MFQTKTVDIYKYNEGDYLGKGQFGTVYKGVISTTNEPVAIKVMNVNVIEDDYMAKLLLNEIDALKKLSSAHIVRFIDLKISSRNIYVITEFCDGGDLASYLQKRGRIPEDEAVAFIDQIVHAFGEMKKFSILHRDLKPANILIHQGKLKIADLGFARCVANHQETLLRSQVGSPIYMSPQLLLGRPYTSKCDIWSLGIMVYQFIYGDIPWQAMDFHQLVRSVTNLPLRFPQGVPISKEMLSFIIGCLKFDENERSSVEELANHPIFSANRGRFAEDGNKGRPQLSHRASAVYENDPNSANQNQQPQVPPPLQQPPAHPHQPVLRKIVSQEYYPENFRGYAAQAMVPAAGQHMFMQPIVSPRMNPLSPHMQYENMTPTMRQTQRYYTMAPNHVNPNQNV